MLASFQRFRGPRRVPHTLTPGLGPGPGAAAVPMGPQQLRGVSVSSISGLPPPRPKDQVAAAPGR